MTTTPNDLKNDAWTSFSSLFLADLKAVDPDRLWPAFAQPTKGSSGETVINAMRVAFGQTFDSVFKMTQEHAFSIDGAQQEPSGAWDDDFREPI